MCNKYFYKIIGMGMRSLFPASAALVLCGSLAACGTTPPPDYSNSWKPLNVYSNKVQEIPLARPYRFYALPIDATLKGLLERWAADSGSHLDYRNPSNFSLSPEVKEIRQAQLNDAVSMLDAIYAQYGVSIQMSGDRQILVTAIPPVPPKKEHKREQKVRQSRGK